MLTWLSIMRHKNADAKTLAHGLDVVERSARSQAQLIEDLLDVSRIIRGKMRIEAGAVDLVRVIELALETLAPAAAGKEVRIDFERPDHDCPIMGDAARLQQVVWNLVSTSSRRRADGSRCVWRPRAHRSVCT
jgi:signal transduction histidine kinase